MTGRRVLCHVIGCAVIGYGCGEQPVPAAVGHGEDCAVDFEHIVRLEGDEVDYGGLAVMHGNTILLRRGFAPYQLAVFENRDGRATFVRTVGESGQGPGEFRVVSNALPLDDGGWAFFDSRNLRLTYLDSSFDVVSTHPLPAAELQAVRSTDAGDFVLSGAMIDAGRSGSVAVRINAEGEPLRYFGSDEAESEGPLRGRVIPRLLAFDPAHGVATMKTVVNYQLEFWNDDGSPRVAHAPSVPWFEWPPRHPAGVVADAPPIGPPEDHFQSLQLDDDGRLWIVAQITPDDWQTGMSDGAVVDRGQWIDHMIEILDAGTRDVVCSYVVEQPVLAGDFAAPGVLTSYDEDESGRPSLDFWRVSLRP